MTAAHTRLFPSLMLYLHDSGIKGTHTAKCFCSCPVVIHFMILFNRWIKFEALKEVAELPLVSICTISMTIGGLKYMYNIV